MYCCNGCITSVWHFWYPYPYREISGGRELFVLVVTVDIFLGPLITLAVFNRRKSPIELRRDLTVTGLLQLAALGYGLWTVAVARPVHMVFEIDRFRVVQAIDVDETLLSQTPKSVQALPVAGPTLLAVRHFKDDKERMEATLAALQGVSLASRPDLWRPYEEATADVLKEAKPAIHLLTRFPANVAEIELVLEKVGRKPSNVVYLPLVGRKSFWTVFLDPVTAQVLTTMPLDSF
ncbi:TfpX/TfpZ family type IV pilin accessory protein [Rhodoferax sp.]|uniref:TfpX/TfpZ family type IV pilin accessory protein n=1 Tax=Rhodoferax sp. TaxID=50421 RepID=UPI002ACEB779|nr:TfpX/TfpZ family type IV pilin accessory protein [Rhodoferax sp.]MDZ7920963.1 TfpX/TfpZ family type IV pilin accessory protein [Rhodoferax sp.]